MPDRTILTIRIGIAGRTFGLGVGKRAVTVVGIVLTVLFSIGAHLIYDARDTRSRLGELNSLRRHVSEQNLAFYRLNARFESLETDVERMRAMDARIRSLAQYAAPSSKVTSETARGGAETPQDGPQANLGRLLTLRFEQLKNDVLVSVKDLEILGDRLNSRRLYLESIPSIRPVRGVLSSPFGVRVSPFTDTEVFHHGIDIQSDAGTAVEAAATGKVVRAGLEALIGNIVEIDHGNGYRTLYGHMQEIRVGVGDVVGRGDVVGLVGSTGRSTGPHLHYEVHINGLPVNPARFMNG